MSKIKIQIGTDTSLECENGVFVEAHNGTVFITGPFEGWMGYQELADMPIEQSAEAEALARKIAAAPVIELSGMGYDLSEDWFKTL